MTTKEKDEFINEALLTFQLWAKGEVSICPLNPPTIQINMMGGRIDRLTKILKEFNRG